MAKEKYVPSAARIFFSGKHRYTLCEIKEELHCV
jgi:hypothetical protein